MTEELKQKLEDKIWYWLCYAQDVSDEDLKEYAKDMTEDIIKLLEKPEKINDFDLTDTWMLTQELPEYKIISWNPSTCRTDSISINSVDDPIF